MAERSVGKASKWCEYLDFLPRSFHHMPMFWTSDSDEWKVLEGTSTADKLLGRFSMGTLGLPCGVPPPSNDHKHFTITVTPFLKKHSARLKVLGMTVNEDSLQGELKGLYRWATAVVSSYAFTIGDSKYLALVPFWDILNHRTSFCNIHLHHNEKTSRLEMLSNGISAGQEVVNNYGSHGNSELLRGYGFVEFAQHENRYISANIHDGVELSLAEVVFELGGGPGGVGVKDALQYVFANTDWLPVTGWFQIQYFHKNLDVQKLKYEESGEEVVELASKEEKQEKKKEAKRKAPQDENTRHSEFFDSDILLVLLGCVLALEGGSIADYLKKGREEVPKQCIKQILTALNGALQKRLGRVNARSPPHPCVNNNVSAAQYIRFVEEATLKLALTWTCPSEGNIEKCLIAINNALYKKSLQSTKKRRRKKR
eukprot:Platyproteum_vivax@DN16203_c0_g1_i1.p1